MKEKRVVITGMGVVSPIGNSIDDFRNSLQEGRGGITALTDMDQYGPLAVHVAGMVKGFRSGFDGYGCRQCTPQRQVQPVWNLCGYPGDGGERTYCR